MRTTVIHIEGGCGVHVPQEIIEQAHLGAEVELVVADKTVIIRSVSAVRDDWAQQAAACHQAGDDRLDDWDVAAGDQMLA